MEGGPRHETPPPTPHERAAGITGRMLEQIETTLKQDQNFEDFVSRKLDVPDKYSFSYEAIGERQEAQVAIQGIGLQISFLNPDNSYNYQLNHSMSVNPAGEREYFFNKLDKHNDFADVEPSELVEIQEAATEFEQLMKQEHLND